MNGEDVDDIMNELYRNAYRNGAFLIVTGDADFEDYALMSSELDRLLFAEDFCGDFGSHTIKIITGLGEGAEALAIRYADEHLLSKIIFSTNQHFHPQLSKVLRDEDMMRLATHLVVFCKSESPSTSEIIEFAKEKGISFILISVNYY